jgi:hypothetical protein
VELELKFVRQTIGDVLLAFLVAVPATSLAQPGWVPHDKVSGLSAPAQKSAVALASTADRQVGLYR